MTRWLMGENDVTARWFRLNRHTGLSSCGNYLPVSPLWCRNPFRVDL